MDSLRGLWQQAPAVQQLQQACARLGLHADVALELVAFLYLSARFEPKEGGLEPQGLSPGTRLDQLWRWMLLNTRVARGIYDLIGGEVDHASTDEINLSDDTKVLRRLATLNLLADNSWTPTLGFWEEPGTVLNSLHRVSYVYRDHHFPKEVQLYIYRGASEELRHFLAHLLIGYSWNWVRGAGFPSTAEYFCQTWVQAADARGADEPQSVPRAALVFQLQPEQQGALPHLQRWTAPPTVPWGPHHTVGDLYRGAAWYLSSSQDPTQQELEAAAGQLRLVQGSCDLTNMGSSLRKVGLDERRLVQVLQQGQEPLPGFSINVRTLTGKTFVLLVHSQMLVKEVKQLVKDRENIPVDMQRFIWRGKQLTDDVTLEECDMIDGGVIHLVMRF